MHERIRNKFYGILCRRGNLRGRTSRYRWKSDNVRDLGRTVISAF